MVGKDYDCSQNKHAITNPKKPQRKPDDYNVRQSKIAIGSGGLVGKGFLKGNVVFIFIAKNCFYSRKAKKYI